MGAYDPTGSLLEGEVFVCVNNGSKGGIVKVGRVLVTRNPCLHPGNAHYRTTHSTVLFYPVLSYPVLCCTELCDNVLYSTLLYRTILCSALYSHTIKQYYHLDIG